MHGPAWLRDDIEPFGDLLDTGWDGSARAVVGCLVVRSTAWGERVQAFLSSLRERERLAHVGLAADMDITLGPDGTTVQEIRRCHGVYLVARSAAGGRFADAGGPPPAREGRRGDVDLITGFLGTAATGPFWVSCPSDVTPWKNDDGTIRVLEAVPLSPDPNAFSRLHTYADTKGKSFQTGAVVASEVLDEADAVDGAVRSTPGFDPREAEEDGAWYQAHGVRSEASPRKAAARQAGAARKQAREKPLPQGPNRAVERAGRSQQETVPKLAAARERQRMAERAVDALHAVVAEICGELSVDEATGVRAAAHHMERTMDERNAELSIRGTAREFEYPVGGLHGIISRLRSRLLRDPRIQPFREILGL